MEVELDPDETCRIELLARTRSKSVQQVLHDIVAEALRHEPSSEAAAQEKAVARDQARSLQNLRATLDAMPLAKCADGLSGSRDHDKILYGRRT